MKIVNQYKNKKVAKKTEQAANLAMCNNLGHYFYMANNEATRYQGFFYVSNDSLKKKPQVYKIIDSIEIKDKKEVTEIKNGFFKLEKKYKDGLAEECFIPDNYNSLCLLFSKNTETEVNFDIKDPYDSRSMGRFYEVKSEGDCLLLKFTKRRDWEEDHLGDKKEFSLYVAIKTDKDDFEKIEEFVYKNYPKDQKRGSLPWERFVFKAFSMNTKKAVFSVAKTKKDAIEEAEKVFKNFDKLYKKNRDAYGEFNIPKITDPEIKMAHLCAQNSIKSLLVQKENTGAYAGIPWFFHFWHRDEAISLPQIYKLDKNTAKKIIISQLDIALKEKRMPNKRFYGEGEVECVDSIGILANSCQKIFKDNRIEKAFRMEVVEKFEKLIPKIIKDRTKNEMFISYSNETWMDSMQREGYRIEVQAGTLALYRFLYMETKNEQYKILLEDLERIVIKNFYKDDVLWDSPEDPTVRPNIFLSYYLYPELLTKEKWEKCFDKVLPELYLKWGGVSSISQVDSRFIPKNIGETSPSYHNGDSWYWINNLTALSLFEINPKKYSEYINEIMEASTKEILYLGTIGHHSEISSAEEQRAEGCEVQLWSSAMYLEFFNKAL